MLSDKLIIQSYVEKNISWFSSAEKSDDKNSKKSTLRHKLKDLLNPKLDFLQNTTFVLFLPIFSIFPKNDKCWLLLTTNFTVNKYYKVL